MFEMWFFTVFGLMWSSPAIIALSLPLAISFSTSISRSESSARNRGLDLRLVLTHEDAARPSEAIVGEIQRLAIDAALIPAISS